MRNRSTLAGAALYVLFSSAVAVAIDIPIAFDDLVDRADTIFLGRVESTLARWETTASGRAIVTDVTFSVDRVYKGRPRSQTTLRFLGGTVGDVSFNVEDAPAFARGDRELLFVSAEGNTGNPLVGGEQGRYFVRRNQRRSESVVPASDPAARPILLDAFEARIVRALKTR